MIREIRLEEIGQKMLGSQLMDISYESMLGQCSGTEVINLVERVVPRYGANPLNSRLLPL